MTTDLTEKQKLRRWHLVLGTPDSSEVLSVTDKRLNDALSALYGDGSDTQKQAGLGRSAPKLPNGLVIFVSFSPHQ